MFRNLAGLERKGSGKVNTLNLTLVMGVAAVLVGVTAGRVAAREGFRTRLVWILVTVAALCAAAMYFADPATYLGLDKVPGGRAWVGRHFVLQLIAVEGMYVFATTFIGSQMTDERIDAFRQWWSMTPYERRIERLERYIARDQAKLAARDAAFRQIPLYCEVHPEQYAREDVVDAVPGERYALQAR